MDLRRWNVRQVRVVLETAPGFAPLPQDGAGVAAQVGAAAVAALVEQARVDARTPIPALPASLYAEFQRNGRREGYEDAQRERRQMLYRLVLAEWLGGAGEFIYAIEDFIWARLEEVNWAWPAHARRLDAADHPTLDLAAAMTALDLAEMDYLVGSRLSAELRARVRQEVERRAIGPFLDRDDHWWLHATPEKAVNNWTAVCVAGVVGAACYLVTDKDRLARIITRGLHSLAEYLETFDSQGGSSEGPDYWSYGFGNYVVLAQILAARTGGKIDLMDDAQIGEIARFPLCTMMAPGIWVSFSDSDSRPQFPPGLLAYLADRLDLPALIGLGRSNDFEVVGHNQFVWPLRQFVSPLSSNRAAFGGSLHDWFHEMGWMISRLDPNDAGSLRLAVKAGHNDEMHNQNDVGSLIVVSKGKVVLTDPGRGRYSKAYFGPERYQNLFASSRGHSVPVVNGFEQAAGAEHGATMLAHDHGLGADIVRFDMAAAYPAAAGIAVLERSVTLDRQAPGGKVLLADRYGFAGPAGDFQSVLVTPLSVEIAEGSVRIGDATGGVVVRFDPQQLAVTSEPHAAQEKQYAPSVDLTRVLFSPRQPAQAGTVALEISPL